MAFKVLKPRKIILYPDAIPYVKQFRSSFLEIDIKTDVESKINSCQIQCIFFNQEQYFFSWNMRNDAIHKLEIIMKNIKLPDFL